MHRIAELARGLIRSGVFVFVVVLAVHGFASRRGPILIGDTQVFTLMADRIAEQGWAAVFSVDFLLSPKWTRLLYVGFVSLARAASRQQWPWLMLVLNLLCDAALAVALVKLTLKLTQSALAGWASLLLFAGAFEIAFWVPYVLSDTPFALAGFLPFYIGASAMLRPDAPASPTTALLAGTAILALLVRPAAIPIVPLVIVMIVWLRALGRPELARALRNRRYQLIGAVAAVTVLSATLQAWVLQDPSRWRLPLMKRQIEVLAGRAATGEVVVSRPATFHTPPASLPDYIALEAARFVRFFQFVADGYSRGHNLLNAAYFTPVFLLALLALIRARRSGDGRRAVIWLAALWIVVFALFHALTILDFNWRYRLPVMPHLILLAAAGLDELVRSTIGKRSGYVGKA